MLVRRAKSRVCMKIIYSLFLVFLITACAANGPRYNDTSAMTLAGQSEIVVYRKKQFAASASCYRIRIDGELLGSLESGSYLKKMVPAGQHTVSVDLGDGISLPIKTTENAKNYILLDMSIKDVSTFGVGTAHIVDLNWNVGLIDVPSDMAIPIVTMLNGSSTCVFEAD